MADVVRAMGLAGVILLAVVIFAIIVCKLAVDRGEASMKAMDKHH